MYQVIQIFLLLIREKGFMFGRATVMQIQALCLNSKFRVGRPRAVQRVKVCGTWVITAVHAKKASSAEMENGEISDKLEFSLMHI